MANYLYKQIEQHILNLLQEHKNDAEYKLPSENKLAQQLGLSRVSVRNALRELEEQDLIYRIKGKGTFRRIPQQALPAEKDNAASIAVILPYAQSALSHDILNGINLFCLHNNIRAFTLFTFNSVLLEANAIATANDLHCAGILIMPIDSESYSDELLKLAVNKKPLVFLDRKLPGLPVPCVSSDHYSMSYTAVKHLSALGHNKIAFFAPASPSSVLSRVNGYEQGLLDCFGHIDKHYEINDMPTHEERIDYFYHFFKNNPDITGIISSSGRFFDALFSAMRRLNKTPFQDFDVVLIDDESPYTEDLLGIRFPTIYQNGKLIGRNAAELLYSKILKKTTSNDDIYIPTIFRKT